MREHESPDESDPDKMEDKKDIYANTLYYFFGDMETLAADAEKQCETQQYYNVAWEVRCFSARSIGAVLEGDATIALPEAKLTNEQREALSALLADIDAIPDAVVNVPNRREYHLAAMRNSCWVPIRVRAREIIALLEPLRCWAYSELGMSEQL